MSRRPSWIRRRLGVPARTHKVRRLGDVMVTMRDGAKLRIRRFGPPGTTRRPALLIRSPYGVASLPMAIAARLFASYGYHVLLQDTRGRYRSEGKFYPFVSEQADGYDTCEWVAQQPWFDGNLAMFGPSYLGYTQWAIAAHPHPALKALIPVITTTDFHGLFYPGGAFSLVSSLRWASTNGDRRMLRSRERRLRRAVRLRPLSSTLEATGRQAPFFRDWLEHPERDAYWAGIDHLDARQTPLPVLNIAGTYDIFCGPQLADHAALATRAAPSHLMIGPWAHGPRALTPRKLGWHQAGWSRVLAPTLRFLHHHLRSHARATHPIQYYEQGTDRWVQGPSWPPPEANTAQLFLEAPGRAGWTPAAGFEQSWTHDPENPVPSLGGTILGPDAGPADQRASATRDDVLVFETPVMDREIAIAGGVRALLHVSSTAPATDFTCKLVHLPAGSKLAINLCDGIRRLHSAPDPEVPVEIDLWHQSVRIRPGDRLRIEVASSNFPRYDVHPNIAGNPLMATDSTPATQRLFGGSQRPSRIEFSAIS